MRRTLAFVFFLVVSPAIFAGGAACFRSDKLERMAVALSCRAALDTLPDGVFDDFVRFEGLPVSVIKENGIVEHIGFSCFPGEERTLLGEYPCRFLERYTLESLLPMKRGKSLSIKLLEDGVIFQQGDLRLLAAHGCDSSRLCRVELVGERRYVVSWTGNGGREGTVIFPASHELLLGRNMEENERRLPDEIREMPSTAEVVNAPDYPVEREDGLLVADGGDYYLPSMRDSRYYRKDGSPVFSPAAPGESVSNLLDGTVPGEEVEVLFKMRAYPLRTIFFQSTVSQLVAYGRKNGFKVYYGTVGVEDDLVSGVMIMRNVGWGCNHVIRVQVPFSVLETGKGQIQARLTPFVPTFNIRYLYEETEK